MPDWCDRSGGSKPGGRPLQVSLKRSILMKAWWAWGMPLNDLVRLDHASVSGLLGKGGIMLGSSRCPEFHAPEVRRRVIDLLVAMGVRGVMVCGGEGSMAGAARLAKESDLRVIGIPATIDNDLAATEHALGFDTAVNTLVWAVSRFAGTRVSHRRILVSRSWAGTTASWRGWRHWPRERRSWSHRSVARSPSRRCRGSPCGSTRRCTRGRQQAIVLVAEKGSSSIRRVAGRDDARADRLEAQPISSRCSSGASGAGIPGPGGPPLHAGPSPARRVAVGRRPGSWPPGSPVRPGKRSPVPANGAASWACAAASFCRTSRSSPTPNAPRRPSSSTSSRKMSAVCNQP